MYSTFAENIFKRISLYENDLFDANFTKAKERIGNANNYLDNHELGISMVVMQRIGTRSLPL